MNSIESLLGFTAAVLAKPVPQNNQGSGHHSGTFVLIFVAVIVVLAAIVFAVHQRKKGS
jgi:hypothetical protein